MSAWVLSSEVNISLCTFICKLKQFRIWVFYVFSVYTSDAYKQTDRHLILATNWTEDWHKGRHCYIMCCCCSRIRVLLGYILLHNMNFCCLRLSGELYLKPCWVLNYWETSEPLLPVYSLSCWLPRWMAQTVYLASWLIGRTFVSCSFPLECGFFTFCWSDAVWDKVLGTR